MQTGQKLAGDTNKVDHTVLPVAYPDSSDALWTQSFTSTDLDAAGDFFMQHGFVVLRDVLPQDDVQSTIDEIWSSPSLLGREPALQRDHPATWEDSTWPVGDMGRQYGFVDPSSQSTVRSFWLNRQHPAVVSTFAYMLGRAKGLPAPSRNLRGNVGRMGVMRPTKIVTADGIIHKPEWSTARSWTHVDQNPLTEATGFHRMQGMLFLSEHTPHSGGFACVPDFHGEEWDAWCRGEATELVGTSTFYPATGTPFRMAPESPVHDRLRCVTGRPGSYVLWDSRLPHCNYPNASTDFRIVQYVAFDEWGDVNSSGTDEDVQSTILSLLLEAALAKADGIEVPFPNCLTDIGRALFHVDPATEEFKSNEIEAFRIVKRAQQHESDGEYDQAVACYRKATKLWPEVEAFC